MRKLTGTGTGACLLAVALGVAACGGAHHPEGGAASSTTTSAVSDTAPPESTSTSSTAPVDSPRWTSGSLPAGVGTLNDVDCPSANQCDAVGGAAYGSGPAFIIASSDGGGTWQLRDKVARGWFSAITCSTVTNCISAGGVASAQGNSPTTPLVRVTTDAGRHWSPATLPAEVGSVSDVACASLSDCVAVGSAVARTSDGGASWTEEASPAGLASLLSVTCPTTSFCIIGGAGPGPGASSPSMSSTSHSGGLSWSPATVAGGPAGLGTISCVSSQMCVGLVGSDATNTYGSAVPFITSDGGASWTEGSSQVGASVTCIRTFCLSVGTASQPGSSTTPGDAFVSNDGGLDWTTTPITTPYSLTSVGCFSSTDCVAVGGSYAGGTPGAVLIYQ
jgi:hypothetical protein